MWLFIVRDNASSVVWFLMFKFSLFVMITTDPFPIVIMDPLCPLHSLCIVSYESMYHLMSFVFSEHIILGNFTSRANILELF